MIRNIIGRLSNLCFTVDIHKPSKLIISNDRWLSAHEKNKLLLIFLLKAIESLNLIVNPCASTRVFYVFGCTYTPLKDASFSLFACEVRCRFDQQNEVDNWIFRCCKFLCKHLLFYVTIINTPLLGLPPPFSLLLQHLLTRRGRAYIFFLAEIFVQSIRESIGIGGGVRWLSWVVINVSLTLCEGRHLSLSLSASILYEMSCGSPRAKCRLLRSRASIYTTLYIFHWRLQPQPQPPTNHCAKLFLLLWSPSPLDAS